MKLHDNDLIGFGRRHPPMHAAIRLEPGSWAHRAADHWSEPSSQLVERVVSELWAARNASRFVLIYNLIPTLREEGGLNFDAAVEVGQVFRRCLCDAVYAHFLQHYSNVINPDGIALEPIESHLDGFNPNPTPIGSFYSTKQLHFDAVEVLGSNLYGPNRNIAGGFPVFADALAYCKSASLNILDIIEKIPGQRIFTLKPPHYAAVLEEFCVAFDVDMIADTPFSIIVNRVVEAGVMHGATEPHKVVADAPGHRPLLHYELVNVTPEAAVAWHAALGQTNSRDPNPAVSNPLVLPGIDAAIAPFVIKLS